MEKDSEDQLTTTLTGQNPNCKEYVLYYYRITRDSCSVITVYARKLLSLEIERARGRTHVPMKRDSLQTKRFTTHLPVLP